MGVVVMLVELDHGDGSDCEMVIGIDRFKT